MTGPVAQRLGEVLQSLPAGTTLVAVSKFHPVEVMREAYDAGQRIFGESRVQELEVKRPLLPTDVQWHFIGHLQTNKVRYIVPYISLIHSVDSVKLLDEIERCAARINRTIDCLLEVHVAQEESKYGFSPHECARFIEQYDTAAYPHIRLRGIMGMASNTDDDARVRADFAALRAAYDLARSLLPACAPFDILSMGMSHDYRLALACGSNMVRIGTTIFGEREY